MAMKIKKCKRCGECCRRTLIEIYEFDTWREPKLIPEVIGKIGENVLYLKSPCAFHRAFAKTPSCAIYRTRPTTCVAHVPGTFVYCVQYDPNDKEYIEHFTDD